MPNSNDREPFDISFIAKKLRMRAGNQHKTVLVLGSRASSLFRSEALYSELQYYGDSGLGPEQPQTKRFGSCHHILTQTQFSTTEIDQLLRKTLTDVAVELEDLCLARLTAMLGLFDVIVTTHLDSLFEQALGMVGWKEMTHFDVYTPRPDLHSYDPLSHQRVPCRIIKIFGQLATSDYSLPKPGYIKLHKPLFDLLQNTLRRDCLVILTSVEKTKENSQRGHNTGKESICDVSTVLWREATLGEHVGDRDNKHSLVRLA